jgi:hypothetical protein
MSRLIIRTITSLAILPLLGCSATTIQSTWTDPTFERNPFGRIAVVALFDTVAENRTFEENAARELEQRGVDAVPSYTILGDDRMYEQDELRAELAEADVDGILIYRLIAVDERNVYRNPSAFLHMPGGAVWGDPYYWYYYPRWDYYSHWRSTWDVTRSPGYWEPLAYVVVESSLYDARRDRLVWTAKSETMDGEQFEALAESVAAKVTDELVARELLRRDSERTAAAF